MIDAATSALGGLGFGGQLATAVSIAAVGWYLWRAGAIASLVVSILGSIRLIGIGVAVLLAIGVALGWIDVSVGAIVHDVLSAVGSVPRVIESLVESVAGVGG